MDRDSVLNINFLEKEIKSTFEIENLKMEIKDFESGTLIKFSEYGEKEYGGSDDISLTIAVDKKDIINSVDYSLGILKKPIRQKITYISKLFGKKVLFDTLK